MRLGKRSIIVIGLVTVSLASLAPAASASSADFQSPSHNIVCDLSGGTGDANRVQCWLMSSRCRNSDAQDFFVFAWSVSRRGRTSRFCPSDFVPPRTTLRYGRSLRRGIIRCTSRKTGMRCANLHTGHGFLLSRAKQRAF